MNRSRSYPLILAAACLQLCGSANADIIRYASTLSGSAEVSPNASPGWGSTEVNYDDANHLLAINVTFSGLLGVTTAAHIHAATATPFTGQAGVATQTPTFVGFPTGVTSGTYSHTFDLTLPSTYNSAFLTANGGSPAAAEAALASALWSGKAYLNIHSSVYGAGEIRGFLSRVPDRSSTASLLLAGLLPMAGLGLLRRKLV